MLPAMLLIRNTHTIMNLHNNHTHYPAYIRRDHICNLNCHIVRPLWPHHLLRHYHILNLTFFSPILLALARTFLIYLRIVHNDKIYILSHYLLLHSLENMIVRVFEVLPHNVIHDRNFYNCSSSPSLGIMDQRPNNTTA